jgi:hypothetical protein
MNEKQLKWVGYVAAGIMLLNFLLFIFTYINWLTFVVVLAVGYLFVKYGLPRLK